MLSENARLAARGWTASVWQRRFEFRDFIGAMKFVNRVADLAESQGHHPDIAIHWNRVDLTLWTHKIGGLHENDFILAAKIDRLLSRTRTQRSLVDSAAGHPAGISKRSENHAPHRADSTLTVAFAAVLATAAIAETRPLQEAGDQEKHKDNDKDRDQDPDRGERSTVDVISPLFRNASQERAPSTTWAWTSGGRSTAAIRRRASTATAWVSGSGSFRSGCRRRKCAASSSSWSKSGSDPFR